MSLFRRPLPITLLAIAMAAASTAAWADPPQDRGRGSNDDPRREEHVREQQAREQQARPRPRNEDALSDSVRRIERSTRGQVLSAERMQSDGRDVNRIKVVDDRGRVRVYMDDPQQGQRPSPPTRDDDD